MTIKEAFDMYINDNLYFQHRSRSSQQHYSYYRNDIVAFLGPKQMSELSLGDIRAWEEHLFETRCQNTVRSYVAGLRQVLKYCTIRGEKCIEASLLCVPQRTPVTVSFVTPGEVRTLIESARTLRTKLIISLLYASGVRISELISLNRDSIKGRQFTVIGKGKKERLCFIDERTERLLSAYLETRDDSEQPLFISHLTGQRVCASTIQLIIRDTVERAGIKGKHITPHTFRHGCVTNLMRNGADLRYVARILGHSNVSTTMIYTHVEDPDLRAKYEKCHTI